MTDTSESDSSGCESSESEKKDEPMSMEEGCSICEISDATDVDPLVYCDECNLPVHKLCYGIVAIPDGDWFCNVCKYWKRKRSKDPLCDPNSCPLKCSLCEQDKGAMKELYRPKKDDPERWAHIVCALFIDEVRFHDAETSTGIIIDDIPREKKVGAINGRKCAFCSNGGYIVKCNCEDKCNKWFHVTCAQSKQLLLMTDNSALAIESDRSTEFHVFCSIEKLKQMRDKKQQESERQKERRKKEKQLEETEERKRIKSKEKFADPIKNEKMAKIKKLQKSKLMLKSPVNATLPEPRTASGPTTTTPAAVTPSSQKRQKLPTAAAAAAAGTAADKPRKRIEKRKSSAEPAEKDQKRTKVPKEPKKEAFDVKDQNIIDKGRKQIYGLFDKFENESNSIDTLERPFIRFQQFIEYLKHDKVYVPLIGPVNHLWAIRQKEKQLNEKLASLRLTRELMEQQIEFQDHFINCVLEPKHQNGYTNGYHDESEGELPNGSCDFKSEVDGDNLSTASANSSTTNTPGTVTTSHKPTRPQLWYPDSDDTKPNI